VELTDNELGKFEERYAQEMIITELQLLFHLILSHTSSLSIEHSQHSTLPENIKLKAILRKSILYGTKKIQE